MEYTITFTPQSISDHLNLPLEYVTDNWKQFEKYLENFKYNQMTETLFWDFEDNGGKLFEDSLSL